MTNNKEDIFNNHPISFNGKTYIFNLDKIKEILVANIGQKETTVAYDLEENVASAASSRVIRELQTEDKSFVSNLTYDFIKLLVVTVLEWPMYEGNKISPGLMIALKTLLRYDIIIELKDENE